MKSQGVRTNRRPSKSKSSKKSSKAKVQVMMTTTMKRILRYLGNTDKDIGVLTPAEAASKIIRAVKRLNKAERVGYSDDDLESMSWDDIEKFIKKYH
jgi:hypothetical protein